MREQETPDDGTRVRPKEAGSTVARALSTGTWSEGAHAAVSSAPANRVGRFEVRRLLGEGAFAFVYLAFDPELGREVAIKVPKAEGLTPEARDVFLRENRLAAIIQHQNICPVYEVGTDGGVPYIVMRVVPNTLAGLLKRLNGTMPARTAVTIVRKLAMGLVAAHAQNVIHRDLKPANILYDEVHREVMIADFGLARFADQGTAASDGVPKGTPAYMSPEQARGTVSEIGPASDIYSLGVILYELLTGRVPFTGSIWEVMRDHCETPPPLPSVVRPGLDPRLDAIILKAMAKSSEQRYPAARKFVAALSGYLQGGVTGSEQRLKTAGTGTSDGPVGEGSRASAFEGDEPAVAIYRARGEQESDLVLPSSTTQGTEVIQCPKCNKRMQVKQGRTRPVDCPLCNVRFAAAAGRQAVAQGPDELPDSEPPEKPKMLRGSRPRRIDDRSLANEWAPAARGLWLTCMGVVLNTFLVAGIGSVVLAAIDQESSTTKTSGRTSIQNGQDAESLLGGTPPGSRGFPPGTGPVPVGPTNAGQNTLSSSPANLAAQLRAGMLRSEYHTSFILLGGGLSVGLAIVGLGRSRAGRLPVWVRDGRAARLSAVSTWLAIPCVAAQFVLINWLLPAPESSTPRYTLSPLVRAIPVCVGFLLLLVGEFAFASYFTSVGRAIGRQFPRRLTRVFKTILWLSLSCAIIGGVATGVITSLDETKAVAARGFFGALAGAALYVALVLVPIWGIVTLVLHVWAVLVVEWYSRT